MASFHLGKLTLFVLLSVADFFLTWRLLEGDGQIVEGNPIAGAFLESALHQVC